MSAAYYGSCALLDAALVVRWQHQAQQPPTAEQQNAAAVPRGTASKLHRTSDTFPDFKAADITTGATYDNTVFGQNKVTVLTS